MGHLPNFSAQGGYLNENFAVIANRASRKAK